jgi:glycosyltransferase involved in cell wall biosynthesis
MLNNEFPPLGGGTGTVNFMLLQRFARNPHLEIDLITSALGGEAETDQFTERIRLFKVPVRTRNIHHSTGGELLTYATRALPLALRLHRARSYDFCFAWSAVPAGIVALALRRFARCRYLLRVCGPDIPGFEQRYRFIYPFLTPFLRATWRAAETVVAKCEGEAGMIRSVDTSVRISTIANGVDLSAFVPGVEMRERKPFQILCVGRLIERKGQAHLFKAVNRLISMGVNARLTLVGTGDAYVAYQEQVRALSIADHVHFVGYVPRENIAACYAAAHVFVLPSYNEGMSVATLEAMAAGLPVIITRTGGSTELVEEGVNGFTFDWADVDALTRYLKRLADDCLLIAGMGRAAREHAKKFSWETAATRYLKLFEDLLNASPITVSPSMRNPIEALSREKRKTNVQQ